MVYVLTAWTSQVTLLVKNPPASARDAGLIPRPGRSPGEGNGNSLQYSCLENSTDRGVHEAASSQTQLGDWAHTHSLWVIPSNMQRFLGNLDQDLWASQSAELWTHLLRMHTLSWKNSLLQHEVNRCYSETQMLFTCSSASRKALERVLLQVRRLEVILKGKANASDC